LRYLEQGHLVLVAESLRKRARWLREVPQHCHWLLLLLPIYRQQARPAWQWWLGLYDGLALRQFPGFARWLKADAVLRGQPGLKADGLLGAWQFWDGQMDEQALGGWVEHQARSAGVVFYEQCELQRIDAVGGVAEVVAGAGGPSRRAYNWLVNACGPWAVQLLERTGISSLVQLDLVRGSNLLVPPPPGIPLPDDRLFVKVFGSRRVAFLLPYRGELLVGTSEQPQQLNKPARASPLEQEELLGLVFHYLPVWLANAQQHGRWFAGLLPIPSRCVERQSRGSSATQRLAAHGVCW